MRSIVSLLCFIGLVGSAQGATALDKELVKAGKLLVAIDATYPPMEFEGDNGKPDGFDVDVAKEIAKSLKLEPEFVVMNWDGILAGLESKRYDVIISSMNITDERKKQVNFVEYSRMSQLFVSKRGVTVKEAKDLAGKIVAVQADTTSHEYLTNQQKAGVKIKEIKAFRGATDTFAAVKSSQAEVIVIDEPVGRYYAAKDPQTFVVTGNAIAPEPIGIAIRKANANLLKEVKATVEKMRQDGRMKKISQKWFGGELGS
jgi:polar amino acid transport system substrate-binding protein